MWKEECGLPRDLRISTATHGEFSEFIYYLPDISDRVLQRPPIRNY